MDKETKSKEKKIIFNEKVDDSINGFAIVIAFIAVGILLQFDNDFFGFATDIIKMIFIVIGSIGLCIEFKKIITQNKIKGISDLLVGLFLLGAIFFARVYINIESWHFIFKYGYQIIIFLFIFISIFGFSRGIIEVIYSIKINYKQNDDNKKGNIVKSIILFLSQLFGLMLIIAQLYDIIK